jgi:NADH-quinone oxidoreductase subunit E
MTNPAPVGAVEELPREKVERFDRELSAIVKRYPPDRKVAAMLPALRLGQEIFGYCSPAVQRLAAERLGTSPSRAEEVATFYVMFHTRKPGKYVVDVCTNLSCSLWGAEDLLAYLEQKLGVTAGESNGTWTLREAECLASCGTAPCLQVNEVHHENLRSRAAVDAVFARLKPAS